MDKEKIEKAVEMIIEAIGEDKTREGLVETPARVARMYEEVFAGIGKTAEEHLSKTFEITEDNIVVVKDINFYSMCEHHFLPFYGKAHIAYIPDQKVAGLSKLARTVETYAKKPQLQERLSIEIADAMMKYLEPRGVKKPGSKTVTAVARGVLETDEKQKQEAFRLIEFKWKTQTK